MSESPSCGASARSPRSQTAFLRHEPMHESRAETAPNFLETNKTDIQEILSANAPAEKRRIGSDVSEFVPWN